MLDKDKLDSSQSSSYFNLSGSEDSDYGDEEPINDDYYREMLREHCLRHRVRLFQRNNEVETDIIFYPVLSVLRGWPPVLPSAYWRKRT